MSQERSFKRAALFGAWGALIFLIVGVLICALWPDARGFVLLERREIKLDLVVLAVQVRFNLFVLLGFVIGWGYCLFKPGS